MASAWGAVLQPPQRSVTVAAPTPNDISNIVGLVAAVVNQGPLARPVSASVPLAKRCAAIVASTCKGISNIVGLVAAPAPRALSAKLANASPIVTAKSMRSVGIHVWIWRPIQSTVASAICAAPAGKSARKAYVAVRLAWACVAIVVSTYSAMSPIVAHAPIAVPRAMLVSQASAPRLPAPLGKRAVHNNALISRSMPCIVGPVESAAN